MKEKFELEFLFKTSPRVLENMISTPTGLAEWFADDVNHEDDLYSFEFISHSDGLCICETNLKCRSRTDEDERTLPTLCILWPILVKCSFVKPPRMLSHLSSDMLNIVLDIKFLNIVGAIVTLLNIFPP